MSAIDQDFVRDLIERHSDASGGNGRDFHNGAYAAMADEIEQAIAATLGPCSDSCNCTNGERTDLDAENAKLREERDHWHVEQVHAYGNWEDAHKRAAELELENAKLRVLCKELAEFLTEAEWLQWPELRAEMQRLGVEVDG